MFLSPQTCLESAFDILSNRFLVNKYNLLLVEPNLEENEKYDLTDFTETNGKADIVAYLVAHKDFKGFITECIELDFCGVKK